VLPSCELRCAAMECYRRRQTTTNDDNRRQRASIVWPPYTMCRRASKCVVSRELFTGPIGPTWFPWYMGIRMNKTFIREWKWEWSFRNIKEWHYYCPWNFPSISIRPCQLFIAMWAPFLLFEPSHVSRMECMLLKNIMKDTGCLKYGGNHFLQKW